MLRNALAAKNDFATPATPGREKSTIKSGNRAPHGFGTSEDDMYDSEESEEEEEYLDDDKDGAQNDEDGDEPHDEGSDLNAEILRTIGPPNSLEFEHVIRD